jgi:DNA-directed RNA polymerase subunit M/transcription elongation factor TFIIS
MKIICIFVDESYVEKNISNIKNDKNIIKYINEDLDITNEYSSKLLYTWKINNFTYKSYGIMDNLDGISDDNILNIFKLPPHGGSELLEQDSSNIKLYNNIYFAKYNNSKIVNLTVEDFQNFYLSHIYSDNEDLSDSEEINNDDYSKKTNKKANYNDENDDNNDDNIDDNINDIYDSDDEKNDEEEEIIDKDNVNKLQDKKILKNKNKKKNIIIEDYELTKNMKILCPKRIEMIEIYYKIIKNKKITNLIEESVFNYTIDLAIKKNIKRQWNNSIFLNLYLSKNRSLYSNINKKCYINNDTFLNRIKKMKITELKNIANLSVYDIFPDNWKYMLEERSKRDKLKYELKPEAMTDMFKCSKCGSRSTSYYEVQTRSADEPMTQFITCLNCNKRWKQ